MGSSPSKNEVVEIRISSSKRREISSDNGPSKNQENSRISDYNSSNLEIDKLRKELDALKNELEMEKENCSQAEEASFSFQTQLDERDREVLLLREEISCLQNTPSSTTPDNIGDTEELNNYDRTVHAKDQYIKTLEDELKDMKQHVNRQNERYVKKLKKLKTALSKSRQDSSLKLFELKDENSKLAENNTKLQERIERMSLDSGEFSRQSSAASTRSLKKPHITTTTDKDVETEDCHDDTRMKLILELSEQVATLDAENTKLKQELKHCRKIQKIAEKVETVRLKKKKNSDNNGADVVAEKRASSSKWKALDDSVSLLEIGEKA